MTPRDVSLHPPCRADDLGHPIPDSPHAISIALPTWRDVIGYEENEARVCNALRSGYPRFRIPDSVRALAHMIGGEAPCLPFPSPRAAAAAAAYVTRKTGAKAQVIQNPGVIQAVSTIPKGAEALHAFWQHTGLT
ncbi:MAG: PLP-dependent transferase, partial [Verrucomicrobia bacterium]|nr:PLP-dependent transferase [Verrucomicrobiota bacterium]